MILIRQAINLLCVHIGLHFLIWTKTAGVQGNKVSTRMAQDRFKKWVICLSFNLILYMNGGFADFLCPGVADMDSTIKLACIFSGPANLFYNNPDGDAVASCASSDRFTQCLSNGNNRRFNGTVVNTTHSFLEINGVQMQDAGEWTCEDQTNNLTRKCSLAVRKTPSCTISSGNNNTELHIGEEVSLSVEIRNHYCSKPIDFLLKTGNTTEELKKALKVDITDLFNSTFRVSESHNGSVQLLFVCNDITESVPCDGVKELIEVDPPLCNIASEGNKSVFYVSEKISITAEVDDYFCSRSIEYQLQAGQSSEMLTGNTDGSKNGSNVFTSIFTITQSHFGPVKIRFLCNNMSKMLYCGGIKNLTEGLTTTSTPLDYSGERNGLPIIPIVAGIVAGVAFTIAISILIWYLVMLRRKSSGKSSGFKDVPYADVSDNVNTRPKSIRFDGAYAEVTDTNGTFSIKGYDKDSKPEIQMVPNPGYESVDDVREELSQSRKSKVQNSDISDIYSKVNKNRMSSASVDGFC